jgi:hypothetical protein
MIRLQSSTLAARFVQAQFCHKTFINIAWRVVASRWHVLLQKKVGLIYLAARYYLEYAALMLDMVDEPEI